MVKARKKFNEPRKERLMHLVQEFEDGGQQICTYKYWSYRWQCWKYETAHIEDFKWRWELTAELKKEGEKPFTRAKKTGIFPLVNN